MRFQGKISDWNDDKGFGFVEPNGGGDRAFVHIKAFESRSRRPANGDIIIYELARDEKNRFNAINIKFTRETKKQAGGQSANPGFLSKYLPVCFIAGLLFLTVFKSLPYIISLGYLALSIVTFIAYALDKSAARNDGWRTQESTLHLLALIGGWPGAIYAQQKLRHKSVKAEFRRVFWVTVFMNIAALGWLTTDSGATILHHLLVSF